MENSITIRGLIFLFIVIENSVTYKIIKNISNFVENIIVNSATYSFFTVDFNMFKKWRASYIGTGFHRACALVWLKLTGLLDWIKCYSNYSFFVEAIRFPYSIISRNAIRENTVLSLGIILTAIGNTAVLNLVGIVLIGYISLFKIEKGIYAIGFLIPFVNSTNLTMLVIGLFVSFILNVREIYPLKIEPYFVLFFILLVGSVITSPVKGSSAGTFILYLSPFVCGYILIHTLDRKEKLFNLFKLNVLSGVFQSIYALLQFRFGISMGGTWIDVEQFGEITTRAMGTLGNPNVLAEYLVLVIMMGCILLFTEKSITNKLLYVVSIGIMLLGLGLTYSRGGYLSLIFAIFIFLVLIDKRLIVLFGIGGVGAAMFMPGIILRRLASITNLADTSNLYRISIWTGTLGLIRSHWLKGTGLGLVAFSEKYQYFIYGSAIAVHSHNLILQITAEMGIFGIIAFLIFAGALVKWALNSGVNMKSRDMRYVIFALVGAVGAHILHGFVDFVWYDPRILFMFWAVAAMLICGIIRGQEAYCG